RLSRGTPASAWPGHFVCRSSLARAASVRSTSTTAIGRACSVCCAHWKYLGTGCAWSKKCRSWKARSRARCSANRCRSACDCFSRRNRPALMFTRGFARMKLVLLADIHEHVEHLSKALGLFQGHVVDQVVVLGDVFCLGQRIEK